MESEKPRDLASEVPRGWAKARTQADSQPRVLGWVGVGGGRRRYWGQAKALARWFKDQKELHTLAPGHLAVESGDRKSS